MDTIRTNTTVLTLQINDGPEVLTFDPTDTLFAEKFYRLMHHLNEREGEFRKRAIMLDAANMVKDENGVPASFQDSLVFMRESCEFFRTEIDLLFGEGTSMKLFGEVYSLPSIGQFFNSITPYIKGARTAKIEKHLQPIPKPKQRVKRR